MTFIIRFIILAAISVLFSTAPDMGNATTYVPGTDIFMTGTTGDARFDVTEALYNSGMAGNEPRLETATKTLKGYFYINTIGWVDFSTGSYTVSLNCGAQDIANLSSDCTLSGTGWSELAGEVGFSHISYLTGGTLSGSVYTLAGAFSLSGIYLPLRPVSLQEDLSNLIVNTSLPLSVSGAYQYGNTSWNLEYTPKTAFFPQTVAGSSEGKFSADISFADDYTLTITDPSGSKTTLDATVVSKIPSTSSFDATNNFIHKFCNIYPAKCPDGTSLSASVKEQDGAGGVVADGVSSYHIKIKPRDMYGNLVNTGTVSIVYDASISSVQIPSDASGPTMWTGLHGDALIFSGELFTPDLANGKWSTSVIPLLGQDISYEISSVAPTDTADNTILLNKVEYTSRYGDIIDATDMTPLVFTPAFVSDVAPISATVQVNAENGFQTSITKTTSQTFTPNFITTLSIGSGANAFFQSFSSALSIDCEAKSPDVTAYNGLCEWAETNGIWFPSVVSIPAVSSFSFSGTYTPTTPYPIEEPVTYSTFIHYSKSDLGISGAYVGSDDIVYPSKSGSFGNSGYRAPKVKIIGQNNALGEYGNIGINGSVRARFIDTVRKNTSILSRNRNNYDSAEYLVHNGDLTVTGGTFDSKRTIVSIGGNITIDGNIAKDSPIAIIALTDKNGNGGNIIINPTVTDIDATLVAEHSILSSGDYQLYIHGSVISANTLGDTLAKICPYYVTATCDETEAAKYDLEKLRTFDGTDSSKVATSPTAGYYPYTPLIIDYNMRLEQDPPPVLY